MKVSSSDGGKGRVGFLRLVTLLAPAAAAAAWPAHAAAEPCPVEVPAEVRGSGWLRAAGALRETLAASADPDCARIQLREERDGMVVTLTTHDGRRAERPVAVPDELVPTVEALLVTIPVAEPAQPPPPPAAPAPLRQVPARPGPSSVPDMGAQAGPLFALQLGTRGGDESLFSPVLNGSLLLTRNRWEVGVLGALEVQYVDLDDQPASDRHIGAMSAGVLVGRREPMGDLAGLASMRFAVAALQDHDDASGTEVRGGFFFGVALPPRASARIRFDLGADLVARSHQDVPVTPEWAVTGLFGMELGSHR